MQGLNACEHNLFPLMLDLSSLRRFLLPKI
jgi:hypothetical protein